MQELVAKVARTTIYITALVWMFLFPLFFLTNTSNFFEFNKLYLTLITLVVLIVAWALQIIGEKRLTLTITPLTLPTLVLGISFLLSTFIGNHNSTESLMGRGSLFMALALIMFLIVNGVASKRFITHAIYTLIGSATILSLISIAQSIGFGLSTLINKIMGTQIPDTLAFTPAGSPLALFPFLAAILTLSLYIAFTRKDSLEKITLFLLSAVMTSGVVLLVIYSFPGKDTAPIILAPEHGYAIAMETLKNTKTALLGFGPESFVVAYNQNRPASINLTPNWNIRFNSSSNELFQAITTGGVVALIAWVLVTVALVKSQKTAGHTKNRQIIKFLAIGLLFLFVLLPGTYLHFFIFFAMLTLWSLILKFEHSPSVHQVDAPLHSISLVRQDQVAGGRHESPLALIPYLLALPLVIGAVFLMIKAGSLYAAETTFKKAVDAANRNEGVPTYDLQREAIVKNPYLPRYRRAYSATNLALANAIAGKQNLTDQDKANITQLIQQSIREAKAAVTLDPQNAQNWENLAVVYRALIGIAQNSDSWTVASLAQAIQADPLNPRLRLELGGVYFSLNQYDQAIRLYQQASELKPDWANAYYNLAATYKQKQENAVAFDYLRQTLSLVKPDSADYAKAKAELEELSKTLNLTAEQQDQSAPPQVELQMPSPAPTNNPENQVDLPELSGPQNIDQNVTVPQNQ